MSCNSHGNLPKYRCHGYSRQHLHFRRPQRKQPHILLHSATYSLIPPLPPLKHVLTHSPTHTRTQTHTPTLFPHDMTLCCISIFNSTFKVQTLAFVIFPSSSVIHHMFLVLQPHRQIDSKTTPERFLHIRYHIVNGLYTQC